MGQIDRLIQNLEGIADPSVQNDVRALVQELLGLHSDGLERLCEHAYDLAGQPLIDALAEDDLVGHLLLLHGLHPLPIETRVMQALDTVRPYLGSHGGNVQLLGVTPDGTVRLRLEGSCEGCPSSRMTLRHTIEEAVYEAAPDAMGLEVEGAVEERPLPVLDGFIPMTEVTRQNGNTNGGAKASEWVALGTLASLQNGGLQAVEVAGKSVVVCRVQDQLYAYGPACPHCDQPLGESTLDDHALTCAACGYRFDVVRAGRGLETPTLHLTPYPLLEENGQARVKVLAA